MKTVSVRQKRHARLGLLLFIPALVTLVVGLIFPLLRVAFMAFRTDTGFGLDNFIRIFSDADLGTAILNSLVFTAVSVCAHLFLGLFFASLLNFELNPRYVKVARSVMIIPGPSPPWWWPPSSGCCTSRS